MSTFIYTYIHNEIYIEQYPEISAQSALQRIKDPPEKISLLEVLESSKVSARYQLAPQVDGSTICNWSIAAIENARSPQVGISVIGICSLIYFLMTGIPETGVLH
jgi:hypothetical protein